MSTELCLIRPDGAIRGREAVIDHFVRWFIDMTCNRASKWGDELGASIARHAIIGQWGLAKQDGRLLERPAWGSGSLVIIQDDE